MKKRLLQSALAILLFLAIVVLAGCGGGTLARNTDRGSDRDPDRKTESDKGSDVRIVPAETSRIEYEDFDNGYLRMQIPKGWTLETPKVNTFSGYTFKLYDPKNPDYLIQFCLGMSGFMKSEASKELYAALYSAAAWGQLPAIDPQTTDQFYRVWNESAAVGNLMINQEFFVSLPEFEVIENLGQTPLGGDVLRGAFVNDDGETLQGLFTTTVVDVGSYYVYGYDLAPLNTYHNIMMYAPDAEFVNWQPIYDHCLSTIEFSDAFMTGFNSEQNIKVSSVRANAKIYDEMSDMIMDSWAARSNSYDIISQKRSDATLGYERVYDTETGEVYRAYNGFMDDYAGTRYKSITDEMYTYVISGYIEK
ncbi:MAG: hypothetical protein IJJ99_00170 [Oscillospiraceae bacterium]|nr:hypothetical protein [Oscillospiraceae bacterium]